MEGTRSARGLPAARAGCTMLDIDRNHPIPIVILDMGPHSVTEPMLDVAAADLVELMTEFEPPWVIIDLVLTVHLTSKAVSVLVQAWRKIKERKGRIAFCGINASSRQVLRMLQLDQHWELYSSREDALNALVPRKPKTEGLSAN